MKTLVITGAARKNGHTNQMVKLFLDTLGGELVLKNLLNDLSTECLGEVCLPNSDHDSLETRPDIARQVVELAEKMKAAQE